VPLFFDDLVDSFYRRLGPHHRDPARFEPGQIFTAPVGYTVEQRQYWRPVGYDQLTQTQAAQFNVVGHAPDLFRRRFPLYAPPLATDEEFIVVRAKRRPVVLFATPTGNLAGAPLIHHHLVIPRYGVVKGPSDLPKYPPEIITRIRSLEFPEMLFTPAEPPLTKDGLLRIDLLQPIAKNHLEPTDLCLGSQALTVLRGQVLHRFLGRCEGDYAGWREMLLNQ
jgi:hypothetical protein